MTVVDDVLQEGDIARLARMHIAALPESLVSLLGEQYARAFYRYCAATSEELLFVERERGELSGACLVSLAPETLSRRLLTRTPLLLFAPLAIRRLPLRAMVLGAAQPAAPQQPRGPEILLIFTAPELRSQGLGARLLGRCEQLLLSRGLHTLLVKTRDDTANRALQFYERAQFKPIAVRSKYGKRLLLLEKSLQA
ncbi:MAG: GNAT family N-acetyltransferase [Deltaproteobacteria bacterium]